MYRYQYFGILRHNLQTQGYALRESGLRTYSYTNLASESGLQSKSGNLKSNAVTYHWGFISGFVPYPHTLIPN